MYSDNCRSFDRCQWSLNTSFSYGRAFMVLPKKYCLDRVPLIEILISKKKKRGKKRGDGWGLESRLSIPSRGNRRWKDSWV